MIRKFFLAFILLGCLASCTSGKTITTDAPTIPVATETATPTLLAASPTPKPSDATITTLTPTPGIFLTLTPTPFEMTIPEPVLNWLSANVLPFEGADPNQGCDDLQPFLDRIGEARIVALGEGTHGTHEFFSMKHRIVECLVTEKGFNLFAIEANMPEVEQINAYVHGEGEVVSNFLYEVWDTTEVQGMIDWIRQHNLSAGNEEKVRFQGFDMQYSYRAAADLLDYLKTADPQSEKDARRLLDCYDNYYYSREMYSRLTTDAKLACREDLQAISDLLLERQPALESNSSAIQFAYALQMARILQQHETMFAETAIGLSSQWRDTFMAENVGWLLTQGGPQARMILWAHNAHIQSEPGAINESESELMGLPVGYPTASMGAHLRQQFGADYLAVGFSFGEGSFNATTYDTQTRSVTQGLGAIVALPPLPNSHEQYLVKVPYPQFTLDLRQAVGDPDMAAWLAEPRWLRAIGSAYDPNNLRLTSSWSILPEAFDMLIHFQHTTASELLH